MIALWRCSPPPDWTRLGFGFRRIAARKRCYKPLANPLLRQAPTHQAGSAPAPPNMFWTGLVAGWIWCLMAGHANPALNQPLSIVRATLPAYCARVGLRAKP